MGLNYSLKNKAFSLLEVVVAVALLAVGITATLNALSFSLRASGVSCDMVQAAFVADDIVQELEFKEREGNISKEPPLVKGNTDKFEWEYTLNLNPELNLYILNLDITWLKSNRGESLKLNTYLR